ncbi:hypothetical protein ACSBR1_043548 [Camellia fascicularis]
MSNPNPNVVTAAVFSPIPFYPALFSIYHPTILLPQHSKTTVVPLLTHPAVAVAVAADAKAIISFANNPDRNITHLSPTLPLPLTTHCRPFLFFFFFSRSQPTVVAITSHLRRQITTHRHCSLKTLDREPESGMGAGRGTELENSLEMMTVEAMAVVEQGRTKKRWGATGLGKVSAVVGWW